MPRVRIKCQTEKTRGRRSAAGPFVTCRSYRQCARLHRRCWHIVQRGAGLETIARHNNGKKDRCAKNNGDGAA